MNATYEMGPRAVRRQREGAAPELHLPFDLHTKMKCNDQGSANTGAVAPAGYTASARQINPRTIEITDKVKDKRVDTQRVEVSPDGKTLTFTVYVNSHDKPQIQVFDRQ